MRKALALLLLAGPTVAGCGERSEIAWNGPGWYLERPRVVLDGRDYYGGPMSYDECEIARRKYTSAELMLCVNETTKPE